MARSLTAGVITETAAAFKRAALFASLAFDSATVYLWSGVGDLVTGAMGTLPAATWTGAGTLGSVSPVEETTELRAVGLTFSLSGVPSSLIAAALDEHYQGRAAKLWLGFFDTAWVLIANPVPLFSGRMDQMAIEEAADTATIRVSAENRLIALERVDDPAYYTPEDQKSRYAGDRGFDFVPKLQNMIIYWGRDALKPTKDKPRSSGAPASTGGGRPGPGGFDGGAGGFSPPRGPK